MSGAVNDHPYDRLSPDLILDAVESIGFECDGRLLALNSYENRVYQVGMEQGPPLIAKFYRPQRWTDEAIGEEHSLSFALRDADLPVVAPILENGTSLFVHDQFRFALFPRQGGREPELESDDHVAWLGRLLGRFHLVGRHQPMDHRRRLLDLAHTRRLVERVAEDEHMADYVRDDYRTVCEALIALMDRQFSQARWTLGAIHGDCHRGNVLWTDRGPHFVDLDDSVLGVAVQDFWMLLDGDAGRRAHQLDVLIDAYEQFCPFDRSELSLIESLRTKRMIEHAGWLASRWTDPAFPRSFPWFGDPRYFEDHLRALQDQHQRLTDHA